MEPREVILSGTRAEQRTATPEAARDGRFWVEPLAKDGEPATVHSKVFPWAETLYGAWQRLRRRDRENDLIYENRTLRTDGKYHPGVRSLDLAGFDSSQLFVSTSIVDTFKARMAKRKTMPMFVVDDAEWDLKRQAQDFGRWLRGKLMESGFDRLYPEIVNDSLVRGDGCVYVDDGDDDVFIERVHRGELLVDPYEARQGEDAVRTIYRFRQVSRDALIARFPDDEKAILDAPEAPERDEASRGDWLASEKGIGRRDVIDFVQAWHLPVRDCGDEGEDLGGRYAACLGNKTLAYEEWTSPRFPFARLSRYKPRTGFWAMGDIERLRPLQSQINRIVADISMNVAATGKGIWIVPEQFDIPVEKLSGYRPFKLTYKGPRAPEFVHPTPCSPAQLDLLERLISKMYELEGAAQWAAQGRSPLGNGVSGVAIDTMEDLLSDRHAVLEEQCAHFRLDVAQLLLDAAGRVALRSKDEDDEPVAESDDEDEPKAAKAKRKRPYKATWMDKGQLEQLDWHKVALKQDQYRLQLEPTGFLPSTRAGKLAAIAELLKTGVMRQDQASRLFDEPDLAHVTRVERAPQENAERMMGIAGDPAKPLPMPEEWHDLDAMLLLCKKYFNRAQNENAPEEVETRYRELGDMIMAVQKQMNGPSDAAPPAGPPGMPPPGAPPMPGPMGPAGPMGPSGMPMGPDGMPIDPSAMGGGMPPGGMAA